MSLAKLILGRKLSLYFNCWFVSFFVVVTCSLGVVCCTVLWAGFVVVVSFVGFFVTTSLGVVYCTVMWAGCPLFVRPITL